MNDLKEILEKRMEEREKDYETHMQVFRIMVENENSAGCFEQNAISALLTLHKMKAEISQIKEVLTLINMLK